MTSIEDAGYHFFKVTINSRITLRVFAVAQGALDKLPARLTENAIQHHKGELKPHETYALGI